MFEVLSSFELQSLNTNDIVPENDSSTFYLDCIQDDGGFVCDC